MINESTIKTGSQIIENADNWGRISLTIFFVLVILGVVFIFLKFFLGDMKVVINNNTSAMRDLTKSVENDLKDVKKKQAEIHLDVKEILHNTRYKYGINDYDMVVEKNKKDE